MNLSDLKNSKIAILWFGKEWKSTLSFLLSIWCTDICVLDKNKYEDWLNYKSQIKFIFWDNYLDNLDSFDYIFKSPWISPYTNNLLKFKNRILTQTKLFFEFYKWKIISITQTKWKSTTATLVYELLKNAWYNIKLVWNIWNPVLEEINLDEKYDFIIYELSSYMLEELDNHHSFISILWNIYPDHLDWHQDFENYKNAKLNILKNSENILVWYDLYSILDKSLFTNHKTFWLKWAYYYHIDNKYYISWKNDEIVVFPKIPWEHNLNNFSAIFWVCNILNIDYKIFQLTIDNFAWLPHRLQNIWTYNGITFIDDSISTTPESTIEAIKTFWNKIWIIFLGGTDRGYNFEDLVKYLVKFSIKNIVLFPDTWIKIKKLLDNSFNYIETNSMNEAVDFAYNNTINWKICLLSTASPSYSIWKNFEEKWSEFQKYVKKRAF